MPAEPFEPEYPEYPLNPLIPDCPAIDIFQEAKVPEPPVKSTLTVKVVVEYAVTIPSIKLDGVTVFAILTLEPTT